MMNVSYIKLKGLHACQNLDDSNFGGFTSGIIYIVVITKGITMCCCNKSNFFR